MKMYDNWLAVPNFCCVNANVIQIVVRTQVKCNVKATTSHVLNYRQYLGVVLVEHFKVWSKVSEHICKDSSHISSYNADVL